MATDSYWFDEAAAQKVVDFFPKHLCHVQGELTGQPFELAPWEVDLLRQMFGWKRHDNPDPDLCTRRYRTFYLEIGSGNGKSTLGGGLGLYLTGSDGEKAPEVYSVASDKPQARRVFGTAWDMIELSEGLQSRFQRFGGQNRDTILYPASRGLYKVLPGVARGLHGLNIHGLLFDELHTQADREIWDTLTTMTGKRQQPITGAFTTAGYDRNSICWEVHERARKIRDGILKDDTFLPIIYEIGKKDDWQAEKTWKKANPNYGISVRPEFIKQKAKEARESPAYENTFRRLHLNQWVSQASRWLPMDAWDACAGPVDREALAGRECYAGLDLSSSVDITALVLVFPPIESDPFFVVLPFFWIPEENIEVRSRRDHVNYAAWLRQGLIETTPGDIVDYPTLVRRNAAEIAAEFQILEEPYDPWNSKHVIPRLEERGITCVEIRQGYQSYAMPMKETMRLIRSRQIRHSGHEVLRWMGDNLMVRQDENGNLAPDRKRSTEKIDGMVAMIMAIGRALIHEDTRSVYESRGLVTI